MTLWLPLKSSFGVSVEVKVSLWANTEIPICIPIVDEVYHLEGKMTFIDEDFHIKATRFYPIEEVQQMLAPLMFSTVSYLSLEKGREVSLQDLNLRKE